MNIFKLNKKITIQYCSTAKDEIGNQTQKWIDFYTCHATVSGESGVKKDGAGLILTNDDISFTVRYCRAVLKAQTLKYRILFEGEPYTITSLDHAGYLGNYVKINCKKWGDS